MSASDFSLDDTLTLARAQIRLARRKMRRASAMTPNELADTAEACVAIAERAVDLAEERVRAMRKPRSRFWRRFRGVPSGKGA